MNSTKILHIHKKLRNHKNPTNSQDIEWLEKEIVAKDFKEYEEYN